MDGKRGEVALNKKGILALAANLVAHKKRYNQNSFGRPDEVCGTVCCLAGFCYSAEIGAQKFNLLAKRYKYNLLERGSLRAGRKQLGLRPRSPEIFGNLVSWPNDLNKEYYANGPSGRVVVALKALSRLRPNGTIDPDPEAVHTKIPALAKLLAKQKKAA